MNRTCTIDDYHRTLVEIDNQLYNELQKAKERFINKILNDQELEGSTEDLKIKSTKYNNFYRELDYIINLYS